MSCEACEMRSEKIEELLGTVKALKIDISGRSEITLLLQQKYEAALLQIDELTKERENLKDILILDGRKLDTANRLVDGLKNALSCWRMAFHFAGCFGADDQSGDRCSEACKIGRAAFDAMECNHEFVNQPLRGGWFCLNCNVQKADLKRIDEPDKCGLCGTPIADSHIARKEAWDSECEWHVCPSCKPRHTH